MQESANFFQTFFNLVLWIMTFVLIKPALRYPYTISKHRRFLVYFLMILFCIYPFWGGDYFHYKEYFIEYKSGGYCPLEDSYKWILDNLGYSYSFFRLIVWGMALFILFKAYKMIEIRYELALFYFIALYLTTFSYARVSLSMAFILLGLVIIIRQKSSLFFNVIISIILFSFAELFHRSAIIGIIAALISLFLINANKKRIILICFIFPIIVLSFAFLLNQFLTFDLNGDTFVTDRHRDAYFSSDVDDLSFPGWGPYISILLSRVPLICIAILYIWVIFKGYFYIFPRSVRLVSSYGFVIIILAIVFMFDFGINTYVLYYRTLNFAILPSAVFLAALKQYGINLKLINIIYYVSLWGVFYILIYRTYCTFF